MIKACRRIDGVRVWRARGVWMAAGLFVAGLLQAAEPVEGAGQVAGDDGPDSAFHEMELLTEVIMQVRQHYVEPKSYDELIYGALDGMLRSLDPHSEFLDADEYEEIKEETEGAYSGLGLQVEMRDGALTVVAPFEGSPAFNAGIQSGDRILAVDGQRTSGVAMRDVVRLMRGDPGTTCTLRIVSRDSREPRDVEVSRADIELPTVTGVELLDGGIGYARVTQFSAPTATSLATAVAGLQTNGLKAIVLDLRGNPGGLLTAAVDVAQIFLPKGQVVVSTKGRSGRELRRTSAGPLHVTDLPMVVLIDGGSASASEIVAGALQDHKRAVLFGETSFGKGSVQSIVPTQTDAAAAIRMTTAYYYTPAGRMIHGTGITPDIVVPMSPRDWRRLQAYRAGKPFDEPPTDIQLTRAVEFLDALLIYQGR